MLIKNRPIQQAATTDIDVRKVDTHRTGVTLADTTRWRYCMIANKTKAALQGRLSHFSNVAENNTTLIDQVNARRFAHLFTNYWEFPLLAANQPFSSMPRDCSSFLRTRFIQAASDSSPSCRCASSINSRSSGSSRNWNGGLPRLSFLCVDTFSTPNVVCLYVITHYMHMNKKATPRSARTLPRRLTKPLKEVTIMADIQSTQTHPKFTWRFLALDASTRNVIHIVATTEREARNQSPAGCVMVFAGRLPVQEAHHA